MSRPISMLGIGPNGGVMDAAVVLNGLLVLVGAIAVLRCCGDEFGTVARWICTLLLALSPLGFLWAGIFTMNTLVGFIGSVPPSEMATGGGDYGLWQRVLGIEVQAWYVALPMVVGRVHLPASRVNHAITG